MKQITENQENINAEINNLVDRIPYYDIYKAPWDLIRKLDSYEIKDLLTKMVNVHDQVTAGKCDEFAAVFFKTLTQLIKKAFEVAKTERKLNRISNKDKRIQKFWKGIHNFEKKESN